MTETLYISVLNSNEYLVFESVCWNHGIFGKVLPYAEGYNHGQSECHCGNNMSRSPWTWVRYVSCELTIGILPIGSQEGKERIRPLIEYHRYNRFVLEFPI
jgi:hypothetical protein